MRSLIRHVLRSSGNDMVGGIVSPDLIAFLRREFTLDWHGIHGACHWSRVRRIGLILTDQTGADAVVIECFAALHDLRRQHDGSDREHGHRSAMLVEQSRLRMRISRRSCLEAMPCVLDSLHGPPRPCATPARRPFAASVA